MTDKPDLLGSALIKIAERRGDIPRGFGGRFQQKSGIQTPNPDVIPFAKPLPPEGKDTFTATAFPLLAVVGIIMEVLKPYMM